MLDDLKKLFSRTWDSFLTEAGRREPEDQVAELLTSMRREMVEARAQLPLLEQNYGATQAQLERERKALDDTRRRGAMAERIGDAETVRVAREFEEKHARRVAVLEEKVRAAKAEWELRQDEAREMMRRYKEADANRFVLVAEIRRQGARGRINAAMGHQSPLSDDFSRAEERIDDAAAYADALDDLSPDVPGGPPPPVDDIEERLREIKRRMGM